jgi:hypothetical protein
LSAPQVAERLSITYPAASKNIGKLVEAGIVEEMPGHRMPTFYRAKGILEVLGQAR